MSPLLEKFLKASIPDDYSVNNVPISLSMDDAHRKELIFQQSTILDEALELKSTPAITLLACIKHGILIEDLCLTSASFREITDKEYFESVQKKAAKMEAEAKGWTDQEKYEQCFKLASLQSIFPGLLKNAEICRKAVKFGVRLFDPELYRPGFDRVAGIGIFLMLLNMLIFFGLFTDESVPSPFLISGAFAVISVALWVGAYHLFGKDNEEYIEKQEKLRQCTILKAKFEKTPQSFWREIGLDGAEANENLKSFLSKLDALIAQKTELQAKLIAPEAVLS